ncbi:hypothetical protein N7G274_002509 [Stereocaulon virgatum]|uniref:Rad4-domain-containing protein n=1 Tax=Stereocaulon virgatum TaxID=373712 RepID=A0ABR4AJ58_9LECA
MTSSRANKTAKSKATGITSARDAVPHVYREMLADAVTSSPTQTSDDGRPIKRRRVGGHIVTKRHVGPASPQSDQSSKTGNDSDLDELFEDVRPHRQQILQTESEDSADSDLDWEEVIYREGVKHEGTPERETDKLGELHLVLGQEGQESKHSRQQFLKRKPATAEEKRLRLDIHKMHLCSLIAHVYIRNHWCNDGKVHTALKKLFAKKTISYLNPDERQSQFQRSRSFMDGLKQASDAFRLTFKITARGLSKPRWADSPETLAQMQPPNDIDLPMQESDFRDAAGSLKASRDVGAQLFCALLRSAGVDTRLVCSLLPLPFQPAEKVTLQQATHGAPRPLELLKRQSTPEAESESDDGSDKPASIGRVLGSSGGRTRSEAAGPENSWQIKRSTSTEVEPARIALRSKKRQPIRDSKYPVYWVEAFNKAVQKWVPIDPLVTTTIAKPSNFEPPAGESGNSMSYVVAFEEDGSARDITRRYAKAYNAKTRRDRVEITPGGERWWRRVMRTYRRHYALDRDQVEDAELAAKEAAEPMPKNVQNFKDHPYYALERHMKRHEVIHPKREVGKVGAGRAANTNTLEPIYRRRDVHMVKSADKWYRMGREIKPGEQPLKRVPARRMRDISLDPEGPDAENAGTALYAAHQTTLHSAPPVENGRIPKNIYGNLDIYVPSMVPPGGVHIAHPETSRAARILGIDYADAVTGFAFKGRHGTAITNGAVIAIEYKEAVEEVVRAFDDERIRFEEERRSAEALRMWKRLLAGLRIRERIEGYDIEGERDTKMKEEMEAVDEDDDEENNEGGGFLPGRDAGGFAQPTTSGTFSPQAIANDADEEGGGFCADQPKEDSNTEAKVPATHRQARDPLLGNTEDEDGCGFLANDSDAGAEEVLRETSIRDFENPILRDTRESVPQPTTEPVEDQKPSGQGSGGSFVPNESDTNKQNPRVEMAVSSYSIGFSHHDPALSPHQPLQNHPSPQPTFPNLPDSELEEARMLQQLYETGDMTQPSTNQQATTTSTSFNTAADDEQHPLSQYAVSASTPNNEPLVEEAEESDRPESDKGSLVSEDPEDEDADPEWLA